MAKIDMPTSSLNKTPGQQPKKKLEKVTTGKVTVRQQTDIQKVASAFLAEDLATVKERIINDYAIPMLKNGIWSIFSSALSLMIFGEDKSRSQSSNYVRGSSNSYVDAGSRAADQLESMGIHRLRAVAVTHYHADHTNGLYQLLARLEVQTLYLPDIEDEYGVRQRLVELAARKGTDVVFVTSPTVLTLGEMTLTVYPPVAAEGDLNEQGLSALATAGDFDLLITGDMAGSTERKLAETYPLPDIEVLVVSHHGSRYSSDETFLRAIRPEVGIISVGDNSYGHPSGQAMERLEDIGADIWRTDRQGTVRVTVKGED